MASKVDEQPGMDLANFFRGMDPSFASFPVPDASPCVLLGPSGSGRSSMLFQYALQVALGGGHVLYISGKEQSQQRRPLLPARLDEDEEAEEAFERIGLKYITTADDLEVYFTQLTAPPDLLIVDTWTDILPLNTTTAVSGLHFMGLMQNATAREFPDMSTGQIPPQTLCLIAGDDDDSAEVRWWQTCPLVLRLEPDSLDPHAVTMTIHKSRAGRHHPTPFCQRFSTASGALSSR